MYVKLLDGIFMRNCKPEEKKKRWLFDAADVDIV